LQLGRTQLACMQLGCLHWSSRMAGGSMDPFDRNITAAFTFQSRRFACGAGLTRFFCSSPAATMSDQVATGVNLRIPDSSSAGFVSRLLIRSTIN
jgi:hypothetical protein